MYRDWRGRFYPDGMAAPQWLPFYATHFDTVENNSTFYRLPAAATVAKWASSVPDGFVFASKLGSFGTHRKKLADPTTWLPRHLERIELLGERRGPCLVQLPARWGLDLGRLETFLHELPADTRWAFEARSPAWLHDDVLRLLERYGVALCVHDLIGGHPQLTTTDWAYVRFHGPDALVRPYHGAYGVARLRRRARWIRGLVESGRDVYAYFNNDWGGAAIEDARRLRRMVSEADRAA